ncbi:FapA family protein, partial [bacterium]|nr:FapA family protein [bacterium]
PEPGPPSGDDLFNASGDEAIKQAKKPKDHLFLRVSDDRMACHVVNFDPEIYQSKKYSCTKEWLVGELERFKIVEEAYEPHLDAALKLMKMEEDLEGIALASGIIGTKAEQPYFFESYKHSKQAAAAESDEKIDFRDLHQTDIVKEGVLVAEVRYTIPEVAGTNVHGKDVPGPPPDKFKVVPGEGIEERERGKYWSTAYGVPAIKGAKISILKVLVHIGDVNMKSGNIIFDGPVEIRGDIDLGATVEATGDIKIVGNIEAGIVRSIHGSVTVEGGIITTERGKVEAKKNVVATFVENSQILAGEKLIVQKALLNSTVHVGDSIELAKNGGGMIAGGKINAGKKIVTPNLGFKNGHVTIVNCGGDWKTEYSISINEARVEILEAYLKKNRADLREITGKRKTDKESLEVKKNVQEKIKKLRPILDKLASRINALKASLTYYSHAEIFVSDMLYINCQISISSHAVKNVMEFREIVITPKKRKGDYIQGIPDYLAFKESQKARLKASA